MNQRGYDNDSEKKNQKIWANLETFLYKLSFLASTPCQTWKLHMWNRFLLEFQVAPLSTEFNFLGE